MGRAIYVPQPLQPAHPHRALGMASAFIGILLHSTGLEGAASCISSAPGFCSTILYELFAGLGAGLIIVGLALMLVTTKPLEPRFVRLAKP